MSVIRLLLLLLTLSSPVWADTVRIDTRDDHDVMFQASGEDIDIVGEQGNIVISGKAGRVRVNGNQHSIVISEANELHILGHEIDLTINQVAKLYLGGDHIDVLVTTSRPVVSDTGRNNSVVSSLGLQSSEQSAPQLPQRLRQHRNKKVGRSCSTNLDGPRR